MTSKRGQNRLAKGLAASKLPYPSSLQEVKRQLSELHDAICSLQSLDDLGSPEANKKAWETMIELQDKYNHLKLKLDLDDY